MLAAISLALIAALQQGPTATVRGQVRSEKTNFPLQGASVAIVSAGLSMHATTDSAGFYVLREVPVGRRLLRATHLDHAPLEVEISVSDHAVITLDFSLELRPVKLPAITARAVAMRNIDDTTAAEPAALTQANVKALEASPGVAEIGIVDMTREVPGQEPPDPSDVLYVRGGTTDLKLVLLNGAPVFAPFHLGGIINPLDADLMRAAKLYVGGAPARYDGGLSYVMDLETRAGRSTESHASVSADLLSTRTVLEGPLTSAVSYLIGARSVHGAGAHAFVGSSKFPYAYADAISRIDIAALGGQLTLSGFWNQESVMLDSIEGGRGQAAWGNTSGSARYRTNVLGTEAELAVAAGKFRTQLPVGFSRPIVTNGEANRLRATANFARTYAGIYLQYGASLDRQRYDYAAWPRTATRDSSLLRATTRGDIAGFYLDGKWQPVQRLTLRSGLRADIFDNDRAPRFAPRIAATFLLTDKATITIAGGSYRQYVRSGTSSGIIGTPLADTTKVSPSLSVARASHVVLSIDQDLGDAIRVALEGYYKAYADLPSTEGDLTKASGVDLLIRRGAGRISGWLGYSLAWIWSVDGGDSNRPHIFAGRQLLSAGATGMVAGNAKIDLRVAYGAGLPFTAIPEPEAAPPVFSTLAALKPDRVIGTVPEDNFSYPAPPDEQYLRVDAQVARTFVTDVRGFAFEITPYFKILNALDRRDALFYHFDRSQQEPQARAVAALPVLPIVGLEWRF